MCTAEIEYKIFKFKVIAMYMTFLVVFFIMATICHQ